MAHRRGKRSASAARETTPSVPAPSAVREAVPSATPWHTVVAGFALVLMVVVSYWPVRTATFVWDDDVAVVGNSLLKDPAGLQTIWFSPSRIPGEEHYWPITYTSYWIEHQLWGESLPLSHGINVLWHAINALLVWRILGRLGIRCSWAAAALFALNPMRVESVAWLIGRKDMLSAFGFLVAFELHWKAMGEGRWRWIFPGLIAFVLAMLSKSIAVSLPVCLLACRWWKEGRLSARDFLLAAPSFIVAITIALCDLHFVRNKGVTILGLPLAERVALAARALWFYLTKWFIPVDLSAVYPKWETGTGPAGKIAWPLSHALLLAALWWARKAVGRAPLAALACKVAILAPILGLIEFSYMTQSYVADRYDYLASIPIVALVGGGMDIALRKFPRHAWPVGGACGLAVLVLFCWMTHNRTMAFQSMHTLNIDTIARNPKAWGALANEGNYQRDQGNLSAALDLCRRSVDIEPGVATTRNNLGSIYERLGDRDKALAEYQAAVRLDPNHAFSHHNLALVLLGLGKTPEALEHLATASRLAPDNAQIRHNHGAVLMMLGRDAEAIGELEATIALDPAYASAYGNLARIDASRGRTDAAIERYSKASQLEPANPEYHGGLAAALAVKGRTAEARTAAARALSLLDPADTSPAAQETRTRCQAILSAGN